MKLTRDQVLQILEMRRAKATNKEICAAFGISLSTLHYWIKRLRKEGHKVPRSKAPGRPAMAISPSSPQG